MHLRDRVLAADAERDAAADALARHYAAGRLTLPELEARVQRVYGARTRGQVAIALNRLPEAGRRYRAVFVGLALAAFVGSLRVAWFVLRRAAWPVLRFTFRVWLAAVTRRRRRLSFGARP